MNHITNFTDFIGMQANKNNMTREEFTARFLVENENINEAKSISIGEMTKWIEKSMKFVSTTDEFDNNKGGIWVSGEDQDEYKGEVIYSYYSEDYKNREFGVLNKWEKELNKRGWYSEWHDAGTVMIWEI